MLKRLSSFGVLLLLAVTVAGCGGGGSGTRYSKPALVACLHGKGVQTQDISHPVTAADFAAARILKPIDPNMIAAKFPSGEIVAVAFNASSAGASKVRGELEKVENRTGGHGNVTQKGAIDVLASSHITAGVQNTLDQCESNAVIK
jgi:hypothetical protein